MKKVIMSFVLLCTVIFSVHKSYADAESDAAAKCKAPKTNTCYELKVRGVTYTEKGVLHV